MKAISILLAVVALSSAQKHRPGPGKHSGAYDDGSGKSAYSQGGNSYSYNGQGASHGGGGPATQKPTYAQLISDSRQLNHDGTINFQYAADNGLQQGETVDPDGTRRGFYSYPGADGKPITVKYTAGKNGFIAEGDHLPKQPNVAAAAEVKEEVSSKPSHGGGHRHNNYDSGAYYPQPQGPSHSQYSHSSGIGPAGPASHGPSHGPSHHEGPGAYSQYNQHGSHSAPRYNPPSPYHDGPQYARATFGGFGQGGPSHHGGQYQSAPQTHYSQSVPSHSGRGGAYGHGPSHAASSHGHMHSALNPYSPVGPAGPYSGNFDLGNGGTYSINFEPGQAVASQSVGASYKVAGNDGPPRGSRGPTEYY